MVGLVMPSTPLTMTVDDGKLGANLSRVRPAAKMNSLLRDSTRTGQANAQNFAIPNPPRFGPSRKYTIDDGQTLPG